MVDGIFIMAAFEAFMIAEPKSFVEEGVGVTFQSGGNTDSGITSIEAVPMSMVIIRNAGGI